MYIHLHTGVNVFKCHTCGHNTRSEADHQDRMHIFTYIHTYIYIQASTYSNASNAGTIEDRRPTIKIKCSCLASMTNNLASHKTTLGIISIYPCMYVHIYVCVYVDMNGAFYERTLVIMQGSKRS